VLPSAQTDVGVLLWSEGLPVVMGVRFQDWDKEGNEKPWEWVVEGKHYPQNYFTHWARPVPPK
jgi:hypothetical protein